MGQGSPLTPSSREGLLPVIIRALELGLSRDCVGQDATFSPLGLSCLGTG